VSEGDEVGDRDAVDDEDDDVDDDEDEEEEEEDVAAEDPADPSVALVLLPRPG
jgi:hypothetical protein